MRSSVVVLEISLYVPAVIWFTRSWWGSRSKRTQVSDIETVGLCTSLFAIQNIALLTILLQPALILVDHGHFQYVQPQRFGPIWVSHFAPGITQLCSASPC